MSKTVRIDAEVAARIRELALPGDTPNAVLRRRMGLEPNQLARSDSLIPYERKRP